MSSPHEEPHLHIDSDWKAQAQAEKERLGRQEEERAAKQGPRGGDPEALPPADFRSLVGVLASQAMSGLGVYGDEKGRVIVDPVGAKFAIDLLGVLEEKTAGNRTPEESADLESILRELRMRFVQVMQLIARQGELPTAAGGGKPGAMSPLGGPAAGGPGGMGGLGAMPPTSPPASGGPRLIVP